MLGAVEGDSHASVARTDNGDVHGRSPNLPGSWQTPPPPPSYEVGRTWRGRRTVVDPRTANGVVRALRQNPSVPRCVPRPANLFDGEQCSKPVDERWEAYPPGDAPCHRNRVEPARQRGWGGYARAYRSQIRKNLCQRR